MIARSAVSALFAGTLAACAAPAREVCIPDYVATVALLEDGTVKIDGEVTPISEIGARLDARRVGGVWIYVQPRARDPLPAAVAARQAAYGAFSERGLVQVYTSRPDFSTYIGIDTGTVYPRPDECTPVVHTGDLSIRAY